MLVVDRCALCAVRCVLFVELLSAVGYLVCVVWCMLLVVRCALCVVPCSLDAVCCLDSGVWVFVVLCVWCLLFVVRCCFLWLHAVCYESNSCCLLFAVCG